MPLDTFEPVDVKSLSEVSNTGRLVVMGVELTTF